VFTVSNQLKALTGYFGSSYDNGFDYPIPAGLNGIVADLWRTITGPPPKAWFALTLPELLLIPRVKVFMFEVSYVDNYLQCVLLLRNVTRVFMFEVSYGYNYLQCLLLLRNVTRVFYV
jgi:hypothetical protein